jgi:hypothetical protein
MGRVEERDFSFMSNAALSTTALQRKRFRDSNRGRGGSLQRLAVLAPHEIERNHTTGLPSGLRAPVIGLFWSA